MKPADRKRIVRAILSSVPGFHEKGRLLAATPGGRILRGIYLEDSSDPARIYVWTFVQPLYAPASTVVFNFGKRLGGPSKTWSADEANGLIAMVRDEGVPFFESVSIPESVASWGFLVGRSDPFAAEAKAYSLVACGRLPDGARALRELAGSLSSVIPWQVEMQERAESLSILAETNPPAALELLASWERETVAALSIQDMP